EAAPRPGSRREGAQHPSAARYPWRTVSVPVRHRTLRSPRPLDLVHTLSPLRRGGADPTFRLRPDGVWRATRTPAGPATERLCATADGALVVEAWGPGRDWLLDRAPALVGELDDDRDFDPRQPLLRELWRRHRGLRIGRTEAVFEATMATVLEQKVPGAEAW